MCIRISNHQLLLAVSCGFHYLARLTILHQSSRLSLCCNCWYLVHIKVRLTPMKLHRHETLCHSFNVYFVIFVQLLAVEMQSEHFNSITLLLTKKLGEYEFKFCHSYVRTEVQFK